MSVKLLLYAVSILCSTFAISGLNINNIFKKGHMWEAKFFILMIIFGLSYLVANFFYDIYTIINSL